MSAILSAIIEAILSSLTSILQKFIVLKTDEAAVATQAQTDATTVEGAKTDADKAIAARKLSDDTFSN